MKSGSSSTISDRIAIASALKLLKMLYHLDQVDQTGNKHKSNNAGQQQFLTDFPEAKAKVITQGQSKRTRNTVIQSKPEVNTCS